MSLLCVSCTTSRLHLPLLSVSSDSFFHTFPVSFLLLSDILSSATYFLRFSFSHTSLLHPFSSSSWLHYLCYFFFRPLFSHETLMCLSSLWLHLPLLFVSSGFHFHIQVSCVSLPPLYLLLTLLVMCSPLHRGDSAILRESTK